MPANLGARNLVPGHGPDDNHRGIEAGRCNAQSPPQLLPMGSAPLREGESRVKHHASPRHHLRERGGGRGFRRRALHYGCPGRAQLDSRTTSTASTAGQAPRRPFRLFTAFSSAFPELAYFPDLRQDCCSPTLRKGCSIRCDCRTVSPSRDVGPVSGCAAAVDI
jgi:hypothetical protein